MIKEQRQGEADNPGPIEQDNDSEEEDMPALVQEEDSELEAVPEDVDEDESDDEGERRNREVDRDTAKAETLSKKEVAQEEEGPCYQPRQDESPHAYYTPGSKRGRRLRTQSPQEFRVISNICSAMAPKRAEIEGWKADVIALQEIRLGSLAQLRTGAKLREENWQAFLADLWRTRPTNRMWPRPPMLPMEGWQSSPHRGPRQRRHNTVQKRRSYGIRADGRRCCMP